MDALKKSRRVQRGLFTKALNGFTTKCETEGISYNDRYIALQLLESRMVELENVNTKYIEALMESDASEDNIEIEMESHEVYKKDYLTARLNFVGINVEQNPTNQNMRTTQLTTEKPYKRPTLEVPKFDGSVGMWLHFWSHFKKIHDDQNISREDKMQYLKMAMEKGSKAEKLLQGYPTSAENYQKAVNSLTNRFGRKELLIEFYTRELLSLVLQNATNTGKKTSVSSLYDRISAQIRALDTLGVKTKECATMLYPLVESSLPEEILRTWQRSALSGEAAAPAAEDEGTKDRLTRLLEFLEGEVENEERINMAVNGFTVHAATNEKKEKTKESKEKSTSRELASASALFSSEKTKKCIFCESEHDNAACDKAKKMSLDARKKVIRDSGCCFKCLKRGHRSKDCKVRLTCAWCGGRHVILVCSGLHNAKEEEGNSANAEIAQPRAEQNLANYCTFPEVYLQTLRIVLYSASREKVVRALIDSGCQRSYIRANTARELGYELLGYKETVHKLFGGVSSDVQRHNVFLVHAKNLEGNYACNFQALDQPIICENVPSIKKLKWLAELRARNIFISDVITNDGNEETIDVLIGADILGRLLTENKVDLDNGLTATETKLGWTVMGKAPTPTIERMDTACVDISMFVSNAKISDLWSLDVLGIKDPSEKLNRLHEEQIVKENFLKTAKVLPDGRYSVDLPWITDHAPVSDNHDLAKKRLCKNVAKLEKEGLYTEYDAVFAEWLSEGIIEMVPEDELDHQAHYLPHRPVIKDGSTTRIRPVFDASACEKGAPALNMCLEKGPSSIELIPTSLLRFREEDIAVLADIRKAFLQIEINRKDRDFLRFFWYVNGRLRVFRHNRVVFGLTCSSFLLSAVLETHLRKMHEQSKDERIRRTIKRLMKSMYVDNCVTSVESIEELELFMSIAKDVMAKAKFDLRGWEFTHDVSPKQVTQVLGISYNKTRDTISIRPIITNEDTFENVSKRTILSTAHKLFDPIGFTAPVTVIPKILLKSLWEKKTDWDAEVDENTREEFLKWHKELPCLNDIEIPRKLGKGNLSLHTFCDASKAAYATVTFLRNENENGVEIKFLAAKTRIAPEKVTIPRLELLAACIGSRQTSAILEALEYENIPVFYWTDSTTVLAWLSRDLQWGSFVFNRVREIRQLTATGKWNFVPGELNPADLPSRGCHARQLLESRWWEGPDWLRKPGSLSFSKVQDVDEGEVNREFKKSAQISMLNVKEQENPNVKFVEKFSSYNKLIRFHTIMLRFKNFKLKGEVRNGQLTLEEIQATELKFLSVLQREMFSSVRDTKLATLNVFIHTDGLIHLKTSITEREDTFAFLYPIVLDKHVVTDLIIREAHETLCHAGVQTVMCQLREKFWILAARKTIRRVISKCIICKKQNVKPFKAEPAPLPVHRVRDASVYEVTGVDFAGPIYLKSQKKAWICLYTCAIYRAVHLELVPGLSTSEFLASFRRFVARRGRPSIVYSDNGTNFTGADNAFSKLNFDVISKYRVTKLKWTVVFLSYYYS